MRKTLTYSTFAATSMLVILAFVTAKTYTQLGVAVLLYPMLIFFAYKLFIGKNRKVPAIAVQLSSVKPAKKVELDSTEAKKEDVNVADIDKRAFLKLIGAAGISYFLFSLLGRRSEALFFGRAVGPGVTSLTDADGNKISPAERQPFDGYRISEIDDNNVTFYGFTNKDGAWFIMKEDPEGSFRYAKGEGDFPGNWNNRENLNYSYFHDAF